MTAKPPAELKVPFIRQDPHQCGAAALAMVLAFHGRPADIDALESEIYIPALRGTIPALMVEAAGRRGLAGRTQTATLEDLITAINRRLPPIVLLAPDGPHDVGHFLVVTGVRRGGTLLRAHGPNAPDIWWNRDAFLSRWEGASRTAVFLEPMADTTIGPLVPANP
ncbi:MAG: C39 family peptidase [Lentisphaerae bacterium]|nr:C39 family peptidase [Lentisphaerota bacterium]